MGRKRWVENWFQRESIVTGLRAFLKENRTSVLYALLAGLSVCVIALAWQGWAYVSVILMVWFAAELFLGRFRNEDTMGTWILFTITLATPLLLAFQWYLVRGQIRVWFDVPVYLFLGAFVLGLAFTVTRDYPWTLVIPSTLIAGAVGLGVGSLVNPTLTNAFFTGAGYFVQSKVVTTIAEDQAPGMSQMILSFGLFTFGLTLVAVAYLVWQIPRRRDPAYNIAVSGPSSRSSWPSRQRVSSSTPRPRSRSSRASRATRSAVGRTSPGCVARTAPSPEGIGGTPSGSP